MGVDASEMERVTGERVESVLVRAMTGDVLHTISREQLIALDLPQLALAWKDDAGKIHRCIGLPIEVVAVESRIVT